MSAPHQILLAALLLLDVAPAQEPQPPPPPPVEPPVTEQPATEQPPTEGEQQPEPPRGERERDRARGGQGPGRRGGEQKLVLPEFTPVPAPAAAGLEGKQYFWFTMYPDLLVKFDPATDRVAHKVKLNGGMFWSTRLTHDQRRMLVVTNQQQTVEVIDLTKGQVVGSHLFQEENHVLRVRDVRECPGGVCWLVRVDRVKKEIDRYSFSPSEWLLYDTQKQKVLQKVRRLPEAIDRGAEISADGTHWVARDRDGNLSFLDGRTFEPRGAIDLKTPRFFGAGAIRLSGQDLLDGRDPKRARLLFTSSDPVEKNRTTWGVVELDLEERRIADVVEWGPSQRSWGMRIAPKKLIGAYMSGGRDDETRLVMVDLRSGKQLAEAYEQFRPRRSLVAISPDADKVYIGTAGSDFEVFDADLKRLSTVELEGEIVGRIWVVDG